MIKTITAAEAPAWVVYFKKFFASYATVQRVTRIDEGKFRYELRSEFKLSTIRQLKTFYQVLFKYRLQVSFTYSDTQSFYIILEQLTEEQK